MRTLYERFPELSVDAPQLRLTLVSVMLVTTRFVGAVGADLSPLPAAELMGPLKKRLVVKASVAIPTVRRERCRVHMMDPPHNESFQDRVIKRSRGSSSAVEIEWSHTTLLQDFFRTVEGGKPQTTRSLQY